MKSRLPASHLFRQFLLFSLTLLCLLTLLRAAYALWQLSRLEQPIAIVPLFVQGLRFDVALVGMLSITPLVIGTLLATSDRTRALARVLIVACLQAGLLLVMVTELVTPWFLETQGLRPDLQLLASVEAPIDILLAQFEEQTVPIVLGAVLCLMVISAYWGRMDLQRFLKRRLSLSGALVLAVVGGSLCVMAVRSSTDLSSPGLSPRDAWISDNATINDLTMNSAYKLLYSLFVPTDHSDSLDEQAPSVAESASRR